jgi:hypothetical protein
MSVFVDFSPQCSPPQGPGHGIHLVLWTHSTYGFMSDWKGFSPLIEPLGSPDPLTHTYLGLYPMTGSTKIQIEWIV